MNPIVKKLVDKPDFMCQTRVLILTSTNRKIGEIPQS